MSTRRDNKQKPPKERGRLKGEPVRRKMEQSKEERRKKEDIAPPIDTCFGFPGLFQSGPKPCLVRISCLEHTEERGRGIHWSEHMVSISMSEHTGSEGTVVLCTLGWAGLVFT